MTACTHRLATGRKETRYYLSCWSCGNKGALSIRSDDFHRGGTEWTGFIGRACLTGPQQDTLICEKCNSTNVANYHIVKTDVARRSALYSFVKRGDARVEVRQMPSLRLGAKKRLISAFMAGEDQE